MKSPLLVLIVRLDSVGESDPYAQILRDAFAGSNPSSAFDARELLQAAEFREVHLRPDDPTSSLNSSTFEFADSAERVLAIILDTRSGAGPVGSALTDVEQAILQTITARVALTGVLSVSLKHTGTLHEPSTVDSRVVRLGLEDLDERDLRLPFLVLYSLHHALKLFLPTTEGSGQALRLFFSHAKRDGVPLTRAVRDFVKRLKGFSTFYDTEDLNLDEDIEAQLAGAVERAVVIVFRTDIFDQRYWCQKEVLWAEQFGRPVVTVDARWQVEHGPSLINFDSTPVVRIPDGNVVRIFAAALSEALRVELFTARATSHGVTLTARCHPIPRYPSLVSLFHACSALKTRSGGAAYVVYPNPALPAAMHAATTGLADACISDCRVVSLDEFRLIL